MKMIMVMLGMAMLISTSMAIAGQQRVYSPSEQQSAVFDDQSAYIDVNKAKDVKDKCDANYTADKDNNKDADIVPPSAANECKGKDKDLLEKDITYSQYHIICMKKTNGSSECP
jgi:hypothetical protein